MITPEGCIECPQGCGPRRVMEDDVVAGFTVAPIYFATLSCGHEWVDISQDTIEVVR